MKIQDLIYKILTLPICTISHPFGEKLFPDQYKKFGIWSPCIYDSHRKIEDSGLRMYYSRAYFSDNIINNGLTFNQMKYTKLPFWKSLITSYKWKYRWWKNKKKYRNKHKSKKIH